MATLWNRSGNPIVSASTDDPGFTEPTDTTSLLCETRRFTRRTDGFVTGDNT